MNIVLKTSRRVIGTTNSMTSVEGVSLPIGLKAKAYRCNHGLSWEPDPPPNLISPVEIPYTLDRDSEGNLQILIDDAYESLFRSDPHFKALS